MRPGSIIVDLAAANGGNCALSTPGETTVHNGVTILAPLNLPASVQAHASELYARTVMAMIFEMIDKEDHLSIDLDSDIIGKACVSHEGSLLAERIPGLVSTN
jgi:NAD(P) transhydrogenase subunit alpha